MGGFNGLTYDIYSADFETTNYKDQKETEIYLGGFIRLFDKNEPKVFRNIDDFMSAVFKLHKAIFYFHNLKFDGSFILDWLLKHNFNFKHKDMYKLDNREFDVVISEMGQWYRLIVNFRGHIIEFRDSAKLLPFSLRKIGEDFDTKHKKLEMNYEGHYTANCELRPGEMEYFYNDLYVLKEALEIMFNEGHTGLTIGACCMKEFKSFYDKEDYELMSPNLYEIPLDADIYGSDNVFDYIRNAYKGGYCYLKLDCRAVVIPGGETYDFNSMYPSKMHSASGCKYPVGKPEFWVGNIPDKAYNDNRLFFVRFKCRFEIKPHHLPTVQIKRNPMYKSNEWLTTSNVRIKNQYYRYYCDPEDESKMIEAKPILTMTSVDYALFKQHYNIYDLEILDGCMFYATTGIYDEYIDKYREIKETSTGAKRVLAKLYSNNLYGKEGTNPDASYKEPYLEDNMVKYKIVTGDIKKPGYVARGAFITSYARQEVITKGQLNYDRLIYIDTDSLHLKGYGEPIGLPIHPNKYQHWAHESTWEQGKFLRQKTYLEIIDGKMDIKACGMTQSCKDYFMEHCTIDDFNMDLELPGKLMQKRVPGGTILYETTFKIKKSTFYG